MWHWAQAIVVPIQTAMRRVHAIDDGDVAELLVVGAAFVVGQRVAMEGRGDELLVGRVGQQVAGDLLDRELVERLVGVERRG